LERGTDSVHEIYCIGFVGYLHPD